MVVVHGSKTPALTLSIFSVWWQVWCGDFHEYGPVACFSKVPKLFGRISGDIILFVSSKLRRLEARNFAVIFIFIPLQHIKRLALQNKQVVILRMAFRARKVLGTFEKRAPGSIPDSYPEEALFFHSGILLF